MKFTSQVVAKTIVGNPITIPVSTTTRATTTTTTATTTTTTMEPFEFEARFQNKNHNILIVLGGGDGQDQDFLKQKDPELAENFLGEIVVLASSSAAGRGGEQEEKAKSINVKGKTVYLCGDLATTKTTTPQNLLEALKLDSAQRVFVIRELSYGYDDDENKLASSLTAAATKVIGSGQVPILYHGVAVVYREFFAKDMNLFQKVNAAHPFHSLTESVKPGTAYRTGTYLSPVEEEDDETGNLYYNLLRCSTNFLNGPTDNFQDVDKDIVGALNREAAFIFEKQAKMNHVLAQIYNLVRGSATQKQVKAGIKAHADKTKDMPENGIMAFVTDYNDTDGLLGKEVTTRPFQYEHKGVSKLTELRFKLKKVVAERPECSTTLVKRFSIPLSPGSVVFIPLSTNRWYTHEVKASSLDAKMIPRRMGYVVRCSNTRAVYDVTDGQTYIVEEQQGSKRRKLLKDPTKEDIQDLRKLYAEENASDAYIDYGKQYFSMNRGDYLMPTTGFDHRTEEAEEKKTEN